MFKKKKKKKQLTNPLEIQKNRQNKYRIRTIKHGCVRVSQPSKINKFIIDKKKHTQQRFIYRQTRFLFMEEKSTCFRN